MGGKKFKIFKFRTMTDARDTEGSLLPDAQRLTKFGSIIRSTSCDEVGELINIIKGDMAIVGPSLLLVKYLDCYTPIQMKRQKVRLGLTGLSHVYGKKFCKVSAKI